MSDMLDSLHETKDYPEFEGIVCWGLYNALQRLGGVYRDSKSGDVNMMTHCILSIMFGDKHELWGDYEFINNIEKDTCDENEIKE